MVFCYEVLRYVSTMMVIISCVLYIYIVTCLTKGNDRIQDMVAPFLEQQVLWIRSQSTVVGRSSVSIGTARYYKGKAIDNS
jgi:hypothetical protein